MGNMFNKSKYTLVPINKYENSILDRSLDTISSRCIYESDTGSLGITDCDWDSIAQEL